MFDTTLFDRNALDRSVSSDGQIVLTMLGVSQTEVRLTIKTPTGGNITGSGSLTPMVQMQQNVGKTLTGTGNVGNVILILRRSTVIPINGKGLLKPNLVIRTPIAAALSGSGNAEVNAKMFLYQNIYGGLTGAGAMLSQVVFKTERSCSLRGEGQMVPRVSLGLPLTIGMKGQGSVMLRRLSGLNENAIELIGINLLPGETVTIDTDLLQVLVGLVEDVSSVTTESVFFELNPGENEIIIDADSASKMDIVAIWQNRWL